MASPAGAISPAARTSTARATPPARTPAWSKIEPAVVFGLDSDGWVPVFPLQPNGNPAIGAGTDCPATDALGVARPAQNCDLGAVEFPGGTITTLEAVASSSRPGTVTLRATVMGETGALPPGSVTFTFDGDEYAAALTSDGTRMVAEVEITGLTIGDTYEYSAAANARRAVPAQRCWAVQYTAAPLPVSVDLGCANPAAPIPAQAPECTGPSLQHQRRRVHPPVRHRRR